MDTGVVSQRLKTLGLSPVNRRLADYWLSLCNEGAPPFFAALQLTELAQLLRYCTLVEVRPGRSLHVRIAGLVLRLAISEDVVGKDYLALTPAPQRAQRLARYSAVAIGAIGVTRRRVLRRQGEAVQIEGLMLPFADIGADDVRRVLVHTDWRPEGEEWLGVDATYVLTLVDEFRLVPFD